MSVVRAVREAEATSPSIIADGELVRRTHAGEREAFSELVRRHQQALYRHAKGMGLGHDAALDLVQDGFVRAYQKLAQCRDPEHFRAWLFRLFRNLVLDYTRDVRRRELPLELAESTPAAVRGVEPETADALARALDALPPLLREAFLLRHREDLEYEQIAERTGARVSAVKMRVMRAREQLRAALADQM